jgi:osmotically-inducible protein OsmY
MKKTRISIALLLGMFLFLGMTSGTYAAQTVGGVIDDSTITTSIKAELAKDVRVGTLTGIEVNTTKGVVTLAGKVHNKEEKQLVEKIAGGVEGVKKVENNLQVVPK